MNRFRSFSYKSIANLQLLLLFYKITSYYYSSAQLLFSIFT